MSLILELGRQKQADLCELKGQPSPHSEFQDSQGYVERDIVSKQQQQQQSSNDEVEEQRRQRGKLIKAKNIWKALIETPYFVS